MKKPRKIASRPKSAVPQNSITSLGVSGFKSIDQDVRLDIRPITILAGHNSSGKSSAIQPLLLLKQTLEASFDPGPLLLDGPCVKFTSVDQFVPHSARGADNNLTIEIGTATSQLTLTFGRIQKKLVVKEQLYKRRSERSHLRVGMKQKDVKAALPDPFRDILKREDLGRKWNLIRVKCFLAIDMAASRTGASLFPGPISPAASFDPIIRRVIHLPGLRGNPQRSYTRSSAGPMFQGTFEPYAAAVIAQWQERREKPRLQALNRSLEELGLSWKVFARAADETRVEILVGRLARPTRGGARDLVNIADVGFGVTQVLPVLVALAVAQPGQLLYLEQPEIHLHPEAECQLAEILVRAALRGVRVIVETHSSVLLLGIQTLVARGKLNPDLVALHWFARDSSGSTKVTKAYLDKDGAFGGWPVDFDSVMLDAQNKYLEAVEEAHRQ
jgi:putative AbiEii toxin of type IV toxin-antitoxin system